MIFYGTKMQLFYENNKIFKQKMMILFDCKLNYHDIFR